MTMYFFYPIQQCAQHIYHTALLLSPKSSLLHKINKQGVAHDGIHVTGFLNAPSDWGLLLTTISVGPRRPTSIATFAERIAVACEDAVNIYDAVTFALEQPLRTPQSVTRIQGSGDGSILYSAHSHSVASWDIQTGGLIDTFHTRYEINDMAISQTDGHIACGLSNGSVAFWNARTKHEGRFEKGQPVVTVCWLSAKLVVATKNSVYITDVDQRGILERFPIPDPVWGMVILSNDVVMVGSSKPDAGGDKGWHSLRSANSRWELKSTWERTSSHTGGKTPTYPGQLIRPIYVGDKIACITPPSGVQVLNAEHDCWIKPSLLEKANSLAVSLGKNLVVQAEDSVQIFSFGVLASPTLGKDEQLSRIYPLGEKHAICLRINRHLTVIELETLQELPPDVDTTQLAGASCSGGPVAEFGVSAVMQAWKSLTPLPKWVEVAEEEALLGGLSPMCTRIVTLYGLPRRELRVKGAKNGTILAKLHLEDDGSIRKGVGVYDLTFESETGFYLKVDNPGHHVQIPYRIIASPSGQYPYTIEQGEPVPLSEPRATSPYTLDASCEWVLDAQSRKICWIPPEDMGRGKGGHFWVGTSLVMLGSDGVVRKLIFKEPDC